MSLRIRVQEKHYVRFCSGSWRSHDKIEGSDLSYRPLPHKRLRMQLLRVVTRKRFSDWLSPLASVGDVGLKWFGFKVRLWSPALTAGLEHPIFML
jgi:hypothetical protein